MGLFLLLCILISDDEEDLNEDTVEKIVKCIIQNEGGFILVLLWGIANIQGP